jgi:uncharacterized phage protein (TIGR01671 family)
MRELKFRVWDKDEQQMVSPDYIDRSGAAFYKVHSIPTMKKETMQYTGLKDKNGKEIYEGDVISSPVARTDYSVYPFQEERFDFIGYVEWDNGFSQYTCVRKKNILGEVISLQNGSKFLMDATIIGNIYENPELLDSAQGGTTL